MPLANVSFRWFSVNMGTGIVSILLHNLPYNGTWLYWISVVIFALNVALFILFLFVSLLRYMLYPEIWVVMIQHPTQSLFLGTFPMGLATIINMVVFVCVPAWGPGTVTLVSLELACEPRLHPISYLRKSSTGLGFVVDRCRHLSCNVLLPSLRNVRLQEHQCLPLASQQ